jgi:hypothetical protein
MLTRLYCTAFNFWNLKVRPVLGSIIPVTQHTFGNPERRKTIWLGMVMKEWTVSPEEARKTRQDDIEMMRIIANRGRR